MSKVNIEFETETGEISMTVNGETIKNISCIHIWTYPAEVYVGAPDNRIEVDVELNSERVGDIIKRVRLSTANTKYAKENAGKEFNKAYDFLMFDDADEDLSEAAADLFRR